MKTHGPVYLLRHGETIWNRAHRLQGQKDTQLTLRGVHQAEAMGRALAHQLSGTAPALFYASPLGRTRQTAAIVADSIKHNSEMTFGIWDGLNLKELRRDHRATWENRLVDKWRFVPPEGESYQQVGERVGNFLADMPEPRPIIIVAHGAHNRVFRGLWRGMKPLDFLALDEPQDGFYRLENGQEMFIPA